MLKEGISAYSEHWDFRQKAEFFATRRIGVRELNAPPEFLFAPRFHATIGGILVRPKGQPKHGYETRDAALLGAQQFKRDSREALKALKG